MLWCEWAAAQTSTTWTGAVSTAAGDPANWSNGVPDLTLDVVIGPAPNGCVGGFGFARLEVRPGGSLTLSGVLAVGGDVILDESILGTGTLSLSPTSQGQDILVRGAPGVSVPSLEASSFATANMVNQLTLRDLTVRSNIFVDVPMEIVLGGDVAVNGAFTVFTGFGGIGQGQVTSEPGASLYVAFLDISWGFFPPANMRVDTLITNLTSSFVPTGGVIVLPPGHNMTVRFFNGGNLADIVVEQGASLLLEDPNSDPGLTNLVGDIDCRGDMAIYSADAVSLGDVKVSGTFTQRPVPGNPFFNAVLMQSLEVEPTGVVTLDIPPGTFASQPMIEMAGDCQVDGVLELLRGGSIDCVAGGTLSVSSAGVLRMIGDPNPGSFPNPIASLDGFDVVVSGAFEARNWEMLTVGDGLQFLAGSNLGAAPNDLRNGRIQTSFSSSGQAILTLSRSEPTVLSELELDSSSAPIGVRATTAQAVQLSNMSGSRGSAQFEDDPLGVVTWTEGVGYFGAGAPGCNSLSTCSSEGGAPELGNGAFGIRATNAHPGLGGIFALGRGAGSAVSFLGVSLWLDLASTPQVRFVSTQPDGSLFAALPVPNDPGLVGLVVVGQFGLFEPAGCSPRGVSASNAIEIGILP